jgi:hypothetical protein
MVFIEMGSQANPELRTLEYLREIEMAKDSAKSDAPAADVAQNPAVSAEGKAQPAQTQQQAPQLHVDDSAVSALYANFCRVTGSPEELIIDFGLNPQPVGIPKDPIKVSQRVILNFYTAKRLLAALQMSVQRHESIFGVLETDIQKRLRPMQGGSGGNS